MKTNILRSVFALTILTLSLVSCSKYEEGPSFSLSSKKSRLCGEWVIEEYTVNGVDMTDTLKNWVGSDFVLEIEKDGTYRTEGGTSQDQGTWELGHDKDDVRFQSSTAGSLEISYRILRLAKKELWLRHTASNGDKEITKYVAKD